MELSTVAHAFPAELFDIEGMTREEAKVYWKGLMRESLKFEIRH